MQRSRDAPALAGASLRPKISSPFYWTLKYGIIRVQRKRKR